MTPADGRSRLSTTPARPTLRGALEGARAAYADPRAKAAVALAEIIVAERFEPAQILRCVTHLLRDSRIGPAASIAEAMIESFPRSPFSFVGRARVSESRSDWHLAITAWDQVIKLDPQGGRTVWRLAHARALIAARRLSEAEEAFRATLATSPNSIVAQTGLLRAISLGKKAAERTLDEIEGGALRGSSAAPVMLARIHALAQCKRISQARAGFPSGLSACESPADFAQAFRLVPLVFDVQERQSMWRLLEEGLSGIAADDIDHAVAVLRLRLQIARGDIASFLLDAPELVACGAGGRLAPYLASALRGLQGEPSPGPKVFGIGLSRTGTTSLRTALEVLGFVAVHWSNPLTNALLDPADIPLFDAFTDATVAERFDEFYRASPNSRFILGLRPPSEWLDSFTRHEARHHGTKDFVAIRRHFDEADAVKHGERARRLHQVLYYHHDNLIAAWNAHLRRVREFFRDKPGALLELDIFSGQGWPELCAFLDQPVPDRPFPWANAAPDDDSDPTI